MWFFVNILIVSSGKNGYESTVVAPPRHPDDPESDEDDPYATDGDSDADYDSRYDTTTDDDNDDDDGF